jgi:hypothetical protein
MMRTRSSLVRLLGTSAVSFVLAAAVGPVAALGATRADPTDAGRSTPASELPRLAITTERLTYRLSQADSLYVGQLVVRIVNQTPDTVFLATPCGWGATPHHQFESQDSSELFFLPAYLEGCALAAESQAAVTPRRGVAVAPDQARRDTIRFAARPFVRRGEPRARQGIARFRLRYTPLVRRGFLHKTWTIDPHVYIVSDPFELLTPRANP